MKEQLPEIRCKGLGVSEGIVIGQVLRMVEGTAQVSRWTISGEQLEREQERFRKAAVTASQQVRTIRDQAEERSSTPGARPEAAGRVARSGALASRSSIVRGRQAACHVQIGSCRLKNVRQRRLGRWHWPRHRLC